MKTITHTTNAIDTISNDISLTGIVSYCKYSGIKLALSNIYTSTRSNSLGYELLPSKHPMLEEEFHISRCYECYRNAKHINEKYIAMIAILVKLDILVCNVPVTSLGNRDIINIEKIFKEFCMLVSGISTKQLAKLSLPQFHNTNENTLSGARLKELLQEYIVVLDASGNSYFVSAILSEDKRSVLDNHVSELYALADDERSLIKALETMEYIAPTKNTSRASKEKLLNKWALKMLASKSGYDSRTIDDIRTVMNANLDTVTEQPLRDTIKLVREGLTYNDYEREQSLMVIRMLEVKLEKLLEIEQEFGLVELEYEETTNLDANAKYKTKTKVKVIEDRPQLDNPIYANIDTSTPLGRMLAKRKQSELDRLALEASKKDETNE